MGGGDLYVYDCVGEKSVPKISAWPLSLNSFGEQNTYTENVFEDSLLATSQVGDALVLGLGEEKVRHKAALPHERELARLKRLLEKLSIDEERLLQMQNAQEIGLILQSELWKYAADAKQNHIITDNSTYPRIELDAKLTVRENMQALFHKAGRGRRGLEYLQKRRQELEEQIQIAKTLALSVKAGAHALEKKSIRSKQTKEEQKKNSMKTMAGLPKGVQAFQSSDGFIILRGKDAKGNGAALRAAAAKDIWLHVEGGPGSHCIIRRHFTGQDIPQHTLQEAASLAAVKSWQRDNPTAQILSAEVRHVKPMRGAALGTVRIDKVLHSFSINIEHDVEQRLAL